MNDSARENPISGTPETGRLAATAVAIECPQCGTQLRLLRPATVHTPIACCICEATFYLQPVATAPMSDAAIAPRRVVNGQGRPTFVKPGLAGLRPADRGPRTPGEPPPPISSPTPPPPSPGTRSAPGMPRPVELPDHMQRGFRTRWMESVLGAALVLLFVVAACAGGYVLFQSIWGNRSPAPSPAIAGIDDPGVDSTARDSPSALGETKAGGTTAAMPDDLGPKVLPRPESLFGTWESRVDDGSRSSFVFRPDGSVDVTQAGDPPPPPLRYKWYVLGKNGDDLTVDIGKELAAVGNSRLTIHMTPPDAFTMIKTVRLGVVQPGSDFRFVRTGPPTAAGSTPASPVGERPHTGP